MSRNRPQQVLSSAKIEMEQAWLLIRKIFDMNSDPLVVLDRDGKMVMANFGVCEFDENST